MGERTLTGRGAVRTRQLLAIGIAALTLGGRGAEETPYWYEVEYLQSDGLQYVDTGVLPGVDIETRVFYCYLDRVPKSAGLDMIGGARTTGGNPTRYYPVSLCGGQVTKGCLTERHVFGNQTMTRLSPMGAIHGVRFNDDVRQVTADSVRLGTLTNGLAAADRTMYVFAANSEHGADWFSCARVWRYEILRNHEVLRDLLPVVDRQGRACFYDRKTGRLFHNAGRGQLTPGPITDGKVTFDLADRTDLRDGLRLVAFSSAPSPTTAYELDAATSARYEVEVRADGLYLAARNDGAVSSAEWTGGAGDGNPENAANWRCRNHRGAELKGSVPGARTVITITGRTTLQAPPGRNLTFATLVLKAPISLAADCDWRGLTFAPFTMLSGINPNGHELRLAPGVGVK